VSGGSVGLGARVVGMLHRPIQAAEKCQHEVNLLIFMYGDGR
jgi:hypothetical protein